MCVFSIYNAPIHLLLILLHFMHWWVILFCLKFIADFVQNIQRDKYPEHLWKSYCFRLNFFSNQQGSMQLSCRVYAQILYHMRTYLSFIRLFEYTVFASGSFDYYFPIKITLWMHNLHGGCKYVKSTEKQNTSRAFESINIEWIVIIQWYSHHLSM